MTPYVYRLVTNGTVQLPVPTAGVYRPLPLIANQSTDVTSDALFMENQGAFRNILIAATDFGTGTVTIQVSPDGVTLWTTITDAQGEPMVVDAASGSQFYADIYMRAVFIRAVLSGSGGGTADVGVFIS